jgi:hypothetical protein
MKEQLITFETAKLAKEKGFNISNSGVFYTKKGDTVLDNPIDKFVWGGKYPASTQGLLQKWLREEKQLFVIVDWTGMAWSYKFKGQIKGICNTYEEALEKGLQEALKLLS